MYKGVAHHTSLDSLHVSGSQGCRICSVIVSELSSIGSKRFEGTTWAAGKHHFSLHDGHWGGGIECAERFDLSFSGILVHGGSHGEQTPAEEEIVSFHIEMEESKSSVDPYRPSADRNQEAAPPIYDRMIPYNHPAPNTRDSLPLLKAWLDLCLKFHSKYCGLLSDFLPTRLIDLGFTPSLSPEDWKLKLVTQADISQTQATDSRYMTLSHRWFDGLPKLTKANMSDLLYSIPVSTLPKKFVDAILVAKSLAIRYLWIDSLCIVQDAKDDWRTEASQMGRIYKASLCNLVAVAASELYDGLFFDRDTSLVSPTHVTISWTKLTPNEFVLVPGNLLSYIEDENHAPLITRGWVLQEQLLAPRAVFFTKAQLIWECCRLEACETYPSGIPDRYSFMSRGRTRVEELKGILHERSDTSSRISSMSSVQSAGLGGHPDALWHHWTAIVVEYTARQLTKDDDRGVAIAGVAAVAAEYYGLDYLGGLWVRRAQDAEDEYVSLLTMFLMLWYLDGGPGSRPSHPRAPSWSWISVNGAVQFPERCYPLLMGKGFEYIAFFATLLRTAAKDRDESQHTGTLSGEVVLRGPLIRPGQIMESLVGHMDCSVDQALPSGKSMLHPDYKDDILDLSSGQFGLLCIFCDFIPDHMPTHIVGLVLEDVGDGCFKRVGYFNSKCPSSFVNVIQQVVVEEVRII
jgi:hypothetical protein